ncbi:zinc ribbon domain-containing protein [Okeania sp. KiyG1]|uniref:zinc ribbon domain-containing protein n=1 Tax=Okeania sp. KiyG1 TaxID=2720165 RepID=UPI0019210703|nr:zinc ribbon domain-containing protein [Okeania sp. KiyG1]
METFLVWLRTVTHPHLPGGEQEGWVSDLGWRQFRTFLDGIAEKYGRDFRVINRWEPTSQTCSCCGFKEHSNKYISRGRAVRDKNGRGGKCNPPPSSREGSKRGGCSSL